jgi:hypothetical protein
MDRRGRLGLDKEMIGAGVGEAGEVALRLDDHQMHIEQLLRAASHRLGNPRPDCDVRHESTIHHVDMDLVRPAGSTARTSSASRPKSADKIDGATIIDLCGAASGMSDPALNAFDPGLVPPHKYP